MRTSPLLSIVALAVAASASAREAPASGEERERRIRVLVNGLYNPTDIGFTDSSTFTSFLEEGRSTRTYDGGKGVVFEVGAIVGITKVLGVMGSVELYQSEFDGSFEESYPHPLYFEKPRTVAGGLAGPQAQEAAGQPHAAAPRPWEWRVRAAMRSISTRADSV